MGKLSQAELGIPPRTFRERTEWCWDIIPKIQSTNQIHPILLIDGTRVGEQICLIVASQKYVIGWSWSLWESSSSWELMLKQYSEPLLVICDGQKGIEPALRRVWPNTVIQRCLFHVWSNIKQKLTLNPQTRAGQDLLNHYKLIWLVVSPQQAQEWIKEFNRLYELHSNFFNERTVKNNPLPGQRRWWYTHRRLRGAYRQINKLVREQKLFAYTNEALRRKIKIALNQFNTKVTIPRTTNFVEGGINSELKGLIRLHRGMPPAHQRRLADWYLYDKTENKKPPRFCL